MIGVDFEDGEYQCSEFCKQTTPHQIRPYLKEVKCVRCGNRNKRIETKLYVPSGDNNG